MSPTKPIGGVTAGLLIGLALLFDGIQFLLTLTVLGSLFSWLVTVIAWTTFLVAFALVGESYFQKNTARKMLISGASIVAELVPIINAIPAITLGVIALIVQNRIEAGESAKDEALARLARRKWQQSSMQQAGQAARNAREMQQRARNTQES